MTTYAAGFALSAGLTVSIVLTTMGQSQVVRNSVVNGQRASYAGSLSAITIPNILETRSIQRTIGTALPSVNDADRGYPRDLVRAFCVGLSLFGLGLSVGILYLLTGTYTLAFVGSLSFAAGTCIIAATLLIGEEFRRPPDYKEDRG